MNKRKQGESIFLRFRLGAPERIPNDVMSRIDEFIDKTGTSSRRYDKVLKELIQPINDGFGYGISFESTWFQLLKEVYEVFKTDSRTGSFNYHLLNDLLKITISHRSINDSWNESKEFLLKHIDQFSMWDISYFRIFSEQRQIKRDETGRYIGFLNGESCEYIGAKTMDEEKFDYIMSTTLGEYGSIYQLLKFVSLIYISIDFSENPDRYPKSLNIYLPESDSNCWFLQWKWNLERLYGYSKSVWRPYLNHCDPDWLTSDLMALYSEEILEGKETNKFELPEETRLLNYKKAFNDFPFQLAYALDTDLRIGQQIEEYFFFKGRYIRWINGTVYTRAIVMIPTKDLHHTEQEEAFINEFISALVWETEMPIRKVFGAGAAKRFLPIVGASKNLGGIIHSISSIRYSDCEVEEREILALALYKEGINSTSVYYSTLNYYKIIELLFKGKNNRIISWINSNRELLLKTGHYDRLKEIEDMGENLAHYIYASCRCAVAHGANINNTVSPDLNADLQRISKDVRLMRELAKHAINEGLFSK